MSTKLHPCACPWGGRHAMARLNGPALSLLAAALVGCSSTPSVPERPALAEVIPAPLPPQFLNGPMALLLTNSDGFRAHAVLHSDAPGQSAPLAAGELMGRGGKLLFAPAPGAADKHKTRPEHFAFIWDVSEARGWLLNDPLQAYAPLSSSREFTNISVAATPAGSAPEKIAGHPCQPSQATVTASDGTVIPLRIWRAADLNGFPLRISCPSNGVPLTLTLSKVRLETMPGDLFLPPNGFTKYESPEAMTAELFLRKNNFGRKHASQAEEVEPGTVPSDRAPSRPN